MRTKKILLMFTMILLMSTIAYAIDFSDVSTAFVVLDTSSLSSREQTVYSRLSILGFGSLNLINSSAATQLVLMNYNLTVVTDSGRLTSTIMDGLINNSRSVLMLHQAFQAYGGTWSASSLGGIRWLNIENKSAFLESYDIGTNFQVAGGTNAFVQSNYPSGWQIIGRNIYAVNFKTAFYKENNGKGAVFTYEPLNLWETGWQVVYKTIAYLTNKKILKTIPLGHVAFLKSGHFDSSPLTSREQTLTNWLLNEGYDITYVGFHNRSETITNYSLAKFIITTEDEESEASDFYNRLIDLGYPIILLYKAAYDFSVVAQCSSLGGFDILVIEENEAFFDNMEDGTNINIGTSGSPCEIHSGFPQNWTIIGRNSYNPSYKTSFYRENTFSGGKGAIFTFDPYYWNLDGWEYLNKMIHYVTEDPITRKIPSGNIAFIKSGHHDNTNLTAREQLMVTLLNDWGYFNITYVPFHFRSEVITDYSEADYVIVTENEEFEANDFYTRLIDSGTSALLIYGGAQDLNGNFAYSTLGGMGNIYVENNQWNLYAYESGTSIGVQGGSAGYFTTHPTGWNHIASNTYNTGYKTVYCRINQSGRGCTYTYDPLQLNTRGKEILHNMVLYIANDEPSISIPNGNVAFIKSGDYDDNRSPLTSRENLTKTWLEEWGFNITYIGLHHRSENITDYSHSKFVIVTEDEDFEANPFYTDLVNDGVNVILVYGGAKDLNDNFAYSSLGGMGNIYVEYNDQGLYPYEAGTSISVQSGVAGYFGSTPAGWDYIARNTYFSGYKTVYCRINQSARGCTYTYDPLLFYTRGKEIFHNMILYIAHDEPSITIPADNVAFIKSGDFDDDRSPLTSRENLTRTWLEDWGYNITYIGLHHRSENITDYSSAKFVISVEDEDFEPNPFYTDLVDDGVSVVLPYNSGADLASLQGSTNDDFRFIRIEDNIAGLHFLEKSSSFRMQTGGIGYRFNSVPYSWIPISRNTYFSGYITVLYRYNELSGGRGITLPYDPYYFTEIGKETFYKSILWATYEQQKKVIPDGDVAFIKLGYYDYSNLTSREKNVSDYLESLGYNMTYIGMFNRSDTITNYDDSSFVITTEDEYFNSPNDFYNRISPIADLILLYGSLSDLGSTQYSTNDNFRYLHVLDNSTFLSGYTINADYRI